jgi:hypothetical protein
VTNASLWHYWHPATASVSDTPPRPLVAGEQVTESIRSGGRRFSARWTVLACEPPALWVIATTTAQGESRIVYELRSDPGDLTRFFRTLAYRSLHWPWTMFDRNLTRSVLLRQSERALANLKRVLEGVANDGRDSLVVLSALGDSEATLTSDDGQCKAIARQRPGSQPIDTRINLRDRVTPARTAFGAGVHAEAVDSRISCSVR